MAQSKRWWELAQVFPWYYFSKHKGKRRDRNGTNRRRPRKRPRKEREEVLQKYQPQAVPCRVPSSCVQPRKHLKPLSSLLLLISSVFWETILPNNAHKWSKWFYGHFHLPVVTICSYSIKIPLIRASLMDWKKPDAETQILTYYFASKE